MKSSRPWIVQPHRPIAKLEENLWTVDGDIRVPGGFVFVRKMALIKLDDGRIALHSPVPLGESDMGEIERWGEPAFCIVPNRFHRLDTPAFRMRYPAIKVVCPGAVRRRVEEVVAVDGGYELLPRELQWHALATTGDEAVFASRNGGRATLIFGDALFNLPHRGGAFGLMLRAIGSSGGPRVTPLTKLAVVADRRRLATQFRELAATQGLVRLVPGHGENITADAPAVLSAVADRI